MARRRVPSTGKDVIMSQRFGNTAGRNAVSALLGLAYAIVTVFVAMGMFDAIATMA